MDGHIASVDTAAMKKQYEDRSVRYIYGTNHIDLRGHHYRVSFILHLMTHDGHIIVNVECGCHMTHLAVVGFGQSICCSLTSSVLQTLQHR